MPLLPQSWSHSLSWALYHFLWQAGVAAMALWLACRLLQNASPRSRYLCSWLALVLCVALPVVTFLRFLSHADPSSGLVRTVESLKLVWQLGPVTFQQSTSGFPVLGVRMNEAQQNKTVAVLSVLGGAWMLGSGLMLWRLRRRWSVLVWHTRNDEPAPPSAIALVDSTAREMGMRHPPETKQSLALGSAVVMGVWRPTLVLPAGFVESLDQDEAKMLVGHELAHMIRRDPIWNFVQCLIETLLFWHPAALWITNRIRNERELCSDELAVVRLGQPHRLADALAQLAAHHPHKACLTLGANQGALLERVRQLLGSDFPKPLQPLRLAFALAAMPVSLVAAFAAHVAMGPVESPPKATAPSSEAPAAKRLYLPRPDDAKNRSSNSQ